MVTFSFGNKELSLFYFGFSYLGYGHWLFEFKFPIGLLFSVWVNSFYKLLRSLFKTCNFPENHTVAIYSFTFFSILHFQYVVEQ